jgi:hypothetical protein
MKIIKNLCACILLSSFASCANWTAADYQAISDGMNSFGGSGSRTYSSERKFCYYYEYLSSPTCFNTYGQCRSMIQMYKGGTCVAE